jgi:hypothetical protein
MKKITALMIFVLSLTVAFAQEKESKNEMKSEKKSHEEGKHDDSKKTSPFETWLELKQFHGVMSATFHPSEEGDLKPIRSRATELKDKAAKLSDSKIPDDLNNEKVKEAVGKLKEQTETMEKMVMSESSDTEVKEYLAVVHDTFHQIVGLCRHEK